MGTGYRFTCSNCGYEKELMEGQGFIIRNWSVKEYLEDETFNFHYKTHRKIERLAKKRNPLLTHIESEYLILVCPHCNIPYSRLYVEVYDDYEVYHRTHFRCSRCNRPLVQTEVDFMETFRCPKCLHETLKGDGSFIDWD
jgi:Zn finger protein HypA/HybF involved in hydrogenase expression